MTTRYFFSLILALFVSDTVDASQIETQIQRFINNIEIKRLQTLYPDAEISITALNSAAIDYLPECDANDLRIENQRPDAIRRTTYSISCTNPTWQSYLPIEQTILIEGVKASVPINRGEAITRSNTALGKVDISTIRGHIYTDTNPPYGMIAKRTIRINDFITDNHTELPDVIRKGNQVLITARSGAIIVKMNGEALEDGAIGEQIRVRNNSSGRIVYGKVVSDSEILVNY
ncbi:flagellar basal body P-ring formation protein FlgA [Maribrevibacterium harenarium]|uniref:Flagella basal body P-ring formation protein FlgA n=1 Tax=Maribrevibacterium harenarium TaxID=2589817 RepID=A0A501X3B1_9GAMM|nr:flagellar basal body P-ring formation chaperone FlgA [Maribrevibacterium harenarium]TPE54933.1 flagellar basal body P-ring formation protein FlgA [Maribrevibacterium harenarium]